MCECAVHSADIHMVTTVEIFSSCRQTELNGIPAVPVIVLREKDFRLRNKNQIICKNRSNHTGLHKLFNAQH